MQGLKCKVQLIRAETGSLGPNYLPTKSKRLGGLQSTDYNYAPVDMNIILVYAATEHGLPKIHSKVIEQYWTWPHCAFCHLLRILKTNEIN